MMFEIIATAGFFQHVQFRVILNVSFYLLYATFGLQEQEDMQQWHWHARIGLGLIRVGCMINCCMGFLIGNPTFVILETNSCSLCSGHSGTGLATEQSPRK